MLTCFMSYKKFELLLKLFKIFFFPINYYNSHNRPKLYSKYIKTNSQNTKINQTKKSKYNYVYYVKYNNNLLGLII